MSGLVVYPDLIQGTEEWFAARCGILTASAVGKLLTPTLKVADNDTSRGVTLTIAAERITGNVDQTPMSADMWRGVEDEPRARAAYSEHHAPVSEVGLMVRDLGGFRLGYSPDGLVGESGLIEIKSRLQKIHLQTILADEAPASAYAQMQAGLLVSGRDWIDYVSYCPGMPLWAKRITPDPAWFEAITAAAQALEDAIYSIALRYRAAAHGLPRTERTPADLEMVI